MTSHHGGIDSHAVIFAIPAHARPSWSAEVDDLCEQASLRGWTEPDYIAAVTGKLGPTAGSGAAIYTLRKTAKERPPQSLPRWIPHVPCGDTSHDARCEICRCDIRNPVHHVAVPVPAAIKAEWAAMFASTRIPEETR